MNIILNACVSKGSTVKRILYTSSSTAMATPSRYFIERDENRTVMTYSSKDWTYTNDKEVTPYAKEKTIVEKFAWDFIKKWNEKNKKSHLEFCTILPTFTVGASLNRRLASSMSPIHRTMNGDFPVTPRIQWSVVGVTDVAEAHVRAMTCKKADGQRYGLCAQSLWMRDVAQVCSLFSSSSFASSSEGGRPVVEPR